jgi:7,8-dihydropterin-6-yl-methyl-4-(beta-D-ribofuranosyl)aminobenzene 5'-phosphate synthase
MLVRVLVENTSNHAEFGSEHGLSLYIETKSHKLLFDTGASALFSENAEKMNVDLSGVNIAVLSHGHDDHSGGIRTFLEKNSIANIYMHEKVFIPYYANRRDGEKEYIGMDQSLIPNRRFAFTEGDMVIEQGLELLSGVKGKELQPSGNLDLYKKVSDTFQRDDFAHEQSLVITENEDTLLVAGCSHKGIVNILEHFRMKKGFFPDVVIGGFHLSNPGMHASEKPSVVNKIADYLMGTKATFYTGHCTGSEAYQQLKTVMGDSIRALSTGDQIEI